MFNKFILITLTLFICFLFSALTMATNSAHVELTKDAWLKKLKEVTPTLMCKKFTNTAGLNKQLSIANIDYKKCLSLIPASFDKCQSGLYEEIPAMITKELDNAWEKNMSECILTDFALNHLSLSPSMSPPSDTSVPKHSSSESE